MCACRARARQLCARLHLRHRLRHLPRLLLALRLPAGERAAPRLERACVALPPPLLGAGRLVCLVLLARCAARAHGGGLLLARAQPRLPLPHQRRGPPPPFLLATWPRRAAADVLRLTQAPLRRGGGRAELVRSPPGLRRTLRLARRAAGRARWRHQPHARRGACRRSLLRGILLEQLLLCSL